MPYILRQQWLVSCITITNVQRRTVPSPNPRRSHSRRYTLPKDGTKTPVCQKFLLQTLGFSSDRIITEVVKKMVDSPIQATRCDNRGMTPNPHSIDRALIRQHIESFHPQINHYRREHAPNVRYLPRDVSLAKMRALFNQRNPGYCGIETYRQTLQEMHISNCMPKEEKCSQCEDYKSNQEPTAREEDAFTMHKIKAQEAKENYDDDMLEQFPDDVLCFAMDMQKVLILPRMPSCKDAFFLSRLVVFNETFAKMGANKRLSYCIFWNESIAGRCAEDVSSAVHALLRANRDIRRLILWCDNCGPQNKNYVLFTMLVTVVNDPFVSCEQITLKYLTKGHTHNAADSVHGNIEQKLRKKGDIYDYEDLLDTVKSARKQLEVIKLSINDFRDWSSGKKSYRTTPVLLSDVVEVQFRKGLRKLYYRKRFTEDQLELDFLKVKHELTIPPQREHERGITGSKKAKIVATLCPKMPETRRQYWANLAESNVRDLCTFVE